MNKIIFHDFAQGSQPWLQFRLTKFGASEAAAMLGLSKKVTRTELLHMKHTGTPKEFSDWVQKNILDYGHEVEALARPIVEETVLHAELYPVTCSLGGLSASCDGLTMDNPIAFEHKQWSEQLAASVRDQILPEEHMPQCQQIMMVTGAEKVLFVVSDGTADKMVHMEVLPDEEWFDRIRAGWAQFEKDLEAYAPFEVIEPPKAPATKDLPAVTIQVRGELTMSNLSDVTPLFDRFLEEAKTNLVTDDDFALAESQSKTGRETAKRCKLTAKAVIDQISTVSEAVRTLEEYAVKFDALALLQEKAVKEQKETRKTAAKLARDKAYSDHISGINAEISPIFLVIQHSDKPDFVGVMKGQRMLSSIYNKLDTELARVKIAADAVAKDVRAKLAWHKENAVGYEFLFADLQQIVYKPADDFQMLAKNRIDQHKADEKKKLDDERVRIAAEEKKKAEDKVRADLLAEELEASKKAVVSQPAPVSVAAQAPSSEAPKPAIPKSAGGSGSRDVPTRVDPLMVTLARRDAEAFRVKFASIGGLSRVHAEIDAFLAATAPQVARETVEA